MQIVQIGCHIGNDHVYDFIKINSCNNILLIDANPYVLDICKNQYKSLSIYNRIKFLNYAIVPTNTKEYVKFYIPKKDRTSAHCSVSLDFLIRHQHNEWEEMDIPCKTLNNLLKENNIYFIDRLYIDAEGLDAQIVTSIDFQELDINYIFFEHTHTDGAFNHGNNFDKVFQYLIDNKYYMIQNDGFNLAFNKQI